MTNRLDRSSTGSGLMLFCFDGDRLPTCWLEGHWGSGGRLEMEMWRSFCHGKKNHLDSEGRSDLLLDTRALRFQGFLEAFLDRDTGRKLLQQLKQKSRWASLLQINLPRYLGWRRALRLRSLLNWDSRRKVVKKLWRGGGLWGGRGGGGGGGEGGGRAGCCGKALGKAARQRWLQVSLLWRLKWANSRWWKCDFELFCVELNSCENGETILTINWNFLYSDELVWKRENIFGGWPSFDKLSYCDICWLAHVSQNSLTVGTLSLRDDHHEWTGTWSWSWWWGDVETSHLIWHGSVWVK